MLRNKMWTDNPFDDWSANEEEASHHGVCFGKGGGSAPSAPTNSTVTQTNLPDYAEPYFKGLLNRTEDASLAGYTGYGGQRIADMSADTTAGFDALRANAYSGTPQAFQTAENTLSGITSRPDLQQQGYFTDPNAVTANENVASFTDSGVASQYMNPYISNVLDTQQARMDQRFNEDQTVRDAAAVQAGAFGNSRRGVVDAIAQRELDMRKAEMDAQGYSQAYQSGSNIFNQERAADLQNRGMTYDVLNRNRAADMQNRALNTDIFGKNQQRIMDQDAARMNAAEQLRKQGAVTDDLAVQRAKNLSGIGGVYDERQQASLDTGYSDFVNQRDFDRNQLNFYSGILRGVPISPQQETLQYNAPPSQTSQLLGLGVGGLSLMKAMQGVPS